MIEAGRLTFEVKIQFCVFLALIKKYVTRDASWKNMADFLLLPRFNYETRYEQNAFDLINDESLFRKNAVTLLFIMAAYGTITDLYYLQLPSITRLK